MDRLLCCNLKNDKFHRLHGGAKGWVGDGMMHDEYTRAISVSIDYAIPLWVLKLRSNRMRMCRLPSTSDFAALCYGTMISRPL